ncbi:Zinc finger protein containing five transmembrane domains [Parahypoxylon ruwenzoriense]
MAPSQRDTDNATSNEKEAHQKTTPHLLRRRSPNTRHHVRDTSVGSMDRIFDTRTESETPRALPSRRPMTTDEEHYADNSFGITELRDGFFDAIFLPPEEVDPQALIKEAELTLPYAFRKKNPLSVRNFLPNQWHEIRGVVRRVTTTRAGIRLLKSFLAFFIAYILCLISPVRDTLGRYSYITVISTILNHPSRTLGAQVDGTILTIVGTATGLGWGAFGLWVSTATATARISYGGVLAIFLFLYIFAIACIRSYYIRTYQAVICAGIAISYTCLAEVSGNRVSWSKLLDYGIPWVLGQAICLVVCITVVPDAGARPLAVALHQAFTVMLEGLELTRGGSMRTRRRLAQTFISMSQAYRDLVIDFSITLFDPKDVLALRNHIQGVIRALLSLHSETKILDRFKETPWNTVDQVQSTSDEFVVDMGEKSSVPESDHERRLANFVASNLAEPTERLLASMKFSLQSCDAVLMEMCGHRQYLGPPKNVSNDVLGWLVKLRRHIIAFGNYQDGVLESKSLSSKYAESPDVVRLFAYCRLVHQAATAIEALLVKVNEMQQRKPEYPNFHLPSYPFWKAIHRSNAQVRHDRGGVTAGSYFKSFSDIAVIIQKITSQEYQPLPRDEESTNKDHDSSYATMMADELEDEGSVKKNRLRHEIWSFLHRLQGFETRFGLKTAMITSLLSIPAWLYKGHVWWDSYEVWWGVVMAWLIMGPRTGGNIQDLFTRAFCAVLGSLWAGLSYAAGKGNPYVIAVFAVIFMLPMIYRYTQSTHPRSGLVGCISFTVISLAEVTAEGKPSPAMVAATHGVAMVIGVVASIIVNWVLWPFVARHDLRKAVATMMFYCSIVYRSIVSRYVYYEEGNEPTKEDIRATEILEGRLREGPTNHNQGLTRHEIRLRAAFDPVPYSALIDACERFFENIVTARQASLFYHPHFIRDNTEFAADLLGHRRDAIATIMTNLYVLSGALRADRKVPKYLPSAAATRKQLLDKMRVLEAKLAASGRVSADEKSEGRKWAHIYSYSYNESLTGCVEQLEELEKFTKAIVGEQGFDFGFTDDDWPNG